MLRWLFQRVPQHEDLAPGAYGWRPLYAAGGERIGAVLECPRCGTDIQVHGAVAHDGTAEDVHECFSPRCHWKSRVVIQDFHVP